MDKEYLLKRWLDNDLSEEEVNAFKALEDADLYEEIIHEAKRFNGDIHAKVSTIDVLENSLQSKKEPSLNWMKIVSRFAAVFVLAFALFMLLDKDNISTFTTDYAQNKTITLPDNSIVKLNESSQVVYNTSNWKKERVIELKGEAFFDVEKGMRFDVNTEFGKVSVLGTEFNVLTRDQVFKVSCYEGLVQVTYNNKKIKLPAGSEFILKSGKVQKTTTVVVEPYWLKNMSVFKNALVEDVFFELEKQYQIKITKSLDDNKIMFTGAFEHDNLKNAIESITQPLNLTYTIENNKEVLIKNVQE